MLDMLEPRSCAKLREWQENGHDEIWEGIGFMEGKIEITDEFIQKRIAAGKAYCVRLYKAGPNRNQPPDETEKIQREHLRYLWQLRAEGKLLVSGPIVDDPEIQGVGIFNTADKEEVKRLAAGDPAVKAGRLVFEVYLWFGMPGDCLPE